MLTRLLPVVVLAVLAGVGCSEGTPAAGLESTPTPAPTPSVSYDPDKVEVAHGAIATIYYRTEKQGNLRVEVENRRTPSGTVTTVLYERQVDCGREQISPGLYSAGCAVAWQRRQTLGANAFTFDPTLNTATLTGTLRGKPIRVTWTGYGTPRRQVGQNGNLLVEMRDARGSVAWGSDRYTDPSGTATPSNLYRRVTDLAKIRS